jgi:hypothetical protein
MPPTRLELRRECILNLGLFFNFLCNEARKTTFSSNFISKLELTEETTARHLDARKRHKHARRKWSLLSSKGHLTADYAYISCRTK